MPRLTATRLAVAAQGRGRSRAEILAGASTASAAWIAAVEAADGQPLEDGVLAAMVEFANYRIPLGGACCLLMGARTLAGALVPLVGPAPTAVNFVEGDYNRRRIVGDTTTRYINTGYSNAATSTTSQHAMVGVVARVSSRSLFGAGVTDAGALGLRDENTLWRMRSRNSGSVTAATTAATSGVAGFSRVNDTEINTHLLGVDAVLELGIQTPLDSPVLVLARGTPAAPADWSNAQVNGYSFGEGLAPANWSSLVGRWYAATAAIGAALP